MSPEPPPAGTPGRWLHHARSDLAYALAPRPVGGLLETLCFHAQQAAEKSLKAVLVHHSVDFPRTHNLVRLVDLLPADLARPPELAQVVRLTPYAVAARYPGVDDEVTEDQYQEAQEAVRLAVTIVAWAGGVING